MFLALICHRFLALILWLSHHHGGEIWGNWWGIVTNLDKDGRDHGAWATA